LRTVRHSKLQLRIIIWSFVPAAIILGAVAWLALVAYQQVTEDLVIERDQRLTSLSASEFAAGLTEYTGLLAEYSSLVASLAQDGSISESGTAAAQSLLEQARHRIDIFDGGVIILDQRGTLVAAEPARPGDLGSDWSNRGYFRQMLRSPRPAFSDITADGLGGAEAIVMAVPILGDQGQFLGIVAGIFEIGPDLANSFYRTVIGLQLSETSTSFLVDSQGRALYHSDSRYIGEDFSGEAGVQLALDRQTGAQRGRDQNHQAVVSFAPVPGTPWAVVNQESWQTLISSYETYRRSLLILVILGMIVPALVVATAIGRITRPIVELIDAAKRVAQGDFGQKIKAKTGDEIEELAQQFNIMSSQLRSSYADLENRAAARVKELAALNAIASTTSQVTDLDEILSDALDRTLQVMEIEAGGIYLLDDAGVLHIRVQRGFDPEFIADVDGLRVGEGFSGRVAESGESLIVPNVSTDPRLTRMAAQIEGLRSMIVTPLSAKGKVLGTMFVVSHGHCEFTDQNVELLTSIGHQIGVAIENARLFSAQQRRAEQFRVISEVGRRITSILDIEELLVEIVRLIQRTFGYDHVGIALVEGNIAEYKVGAGRLWEDSNFDFQPKRLKVGSEGITGWVAGTGGSLLVPDVSQEPRYVLMEGCNTQSELTVPIKVKGEVIGVLDVQSDRPNAFDGTDLAVVESLAQWAALAMENARLVEQTEELAAVRERSRLARELHDAVTQTLFSASLIAEALPSCWEKDPVEGQVLLNELRQMTRGALAEMRTLLMELRPAALAETSLRDLLHQLAEAFIGREGAEVVIDVDDGCNLPADVHISLYRIAQEALNNVVKHARATQVTITLACSSANHHTTAELVVRDNGRGFSASQVLPDCLGLAIMEERAQAINGQLEVNSHPGQGTEVRVHWTGSEKR
jgi:nitrate/nitrite-specific signal transduction histidine kinase